jgi:hypothetical protein
VGSDVEIRPVLTTFKIASQLPWGRLSWRALGYARGMRNFFLSKWNLGTIPAAYRTIGSISHAMADAGQSRLPISPTIIIPGMSHATTHRGFLQDRPIVLERGRARATFR